MQIWLRICWKPWIESKTLRRFDILTEGIDVIIDESEEMTVDVSTEYGSDTDTDVDNLFLMTDQKTL